MSPPDARPRLFTRAVWAVLAYNLAVILWGAWVRVTGSGAGCGEHWPLCNGVVVPREPAIETVIELTHRVTSGLALLATVGLLVAARRVFPAGHRARRAAGWTMGFMVAEAGVGALLVLQGLVAKDDSAARALVMCLHLVNTFLLLGAYLFTGLFAAGMPALDLRRRPTVTAGLGAAAGMMLLVGTTGAIAALGDTLFPSSTLLEGIAQDLSPAAHFLLRLRVLHPVFAVATGLVLLGFAGLVSAHTRVMRVRLFAVGLVGAVALQIMLGFINLILLAPGWMQLVHLLVADGLWLLLLATGAQALAEPQAER